METRKISYTTTGTCSKLINVEIDEDNRVVGVEFYGGCHGNLQGITSLVRGMKAEEVISKLEGIRCGMKPTSCPDQLSKALRQALEA